MRPGLRAHVFFGGAAIALAAVPGVGAPPGSGFGNQQVNPVYVDDSPTATDTFIRVREHVGAGNLDEGVRVLQVLLDEQPDRLLASPGDADLFVSVRAAVHDLLLSTPALLERYRATLGPRAQRQLSEGQVDAVERSLLLTPAGADAVLRLAQGAMEDARFEHARLLLEQLDRHPDRQAAGSDRAKQAAALMGLLARYLDRPEIKAAAARWAKDARMAAPGVAPEPWPAGAKLRAASPMVPLELPNAQGMVSKPLWTVPLNPGATQPEANLNGPGMGGSRGQVSVPMFARDLLLIPTVSGDTVYVSDGTLIGAWDRFTLTPRWSVAPGAGDGPPPDQGIRGDRRRLERMQFGGMSGRNDDLGTVAVSGRFVIAATGRTVSVSRTDGDDRVHALDATTGRMRWSVQLNTLDPLQLYDATVRGPIQIVESTVVFAARKHLPDRRLVSMALVGLDLPTGKLRWVRPVGSAGSMPWVLQSMGADGITVADGVAFRADRLGVVGAVEAGTGRARWIRRMGVDTSANSEQAAPWQMGFPVVDGSEDGGGSIVTLAPDMRHIVRLDRATGAVLGQRDVADFPSVGPRYLLRVGNSLACIGDERVAFIPAASFESAKPEVTPAIPPPGIRGRCVVAGDRLLIPTVTGYSLVDPARPGEAANAPLEETGNVLPVDSQLIVADDVRIHSYLLWDVAEKLLSQRIRADPKDPAPAVTYAELAYRAGHNEKIVPAVQMAMSALHGGPQNEATWSARARLIESMQGMLAAALEPSPAGATGPSHGPKGPLSVKPITDRALLQQLVTLLGELSFQPEDKLAHTLAVGRLSEMDAKPAGPENAVAAYQRVLSDPALAGATWRGPQVSIRGELEAARRIESLLKQHGVQVYAAQERAAAGELAALGQAPTEEQLESLAARYPLAQITPGVWQRVSDLREEAGKLQQAASALEAGLRSATRQPSPPPQVVGELAGRLVVGLRQRQQVAAAAGVLRSVRARFPGLTLTSAGQALDADRLGAELAEKIAAQMRWPHVGALRTDGSQVIQGWSVMEALLSDRAPNVTGLLPMLRDDPAEVSVWTVSNTEHAGKHELLAKAWSQPLGEGWRAHLIKATPDAAYFALAKEADVSVLKVAGSPLEAKWRTEPLSKIFSGADSRGMRNVPGTRPGIQTPAEGETQPTNLIVVMDERTVVLVQRAGRAVAFDTDTGEKLWDGRIGVGRVYDADLASGTLAIAGDQEVYGPGGQVADLRPVIQVVDARTGRAAQRIGDLGGHVRWVGFTDAGSLIAALDGSVVCLDLASAQPNWTISNQDAMPASAMWIFGDHLVIADQNRSLWLASVSTGRLRPAALDLPRSHIDISQTMDAFPLNAVPGTGFGVATQQGLALFGPDGTLTGVDGMDGVAAMLRPRPAEGRAVTIETVADGRTPDGMMFFSVHAMDTSGATGGALLDSRQLPLGARPSGMTLLDDRVAITAGNVTVVVRAPANPNR